MATGSIEYARAVVVVDHPLERVWAIVGAFGGLEHWAAGVSACAVDGDVRTVTRNGSTVRERLDRRDADTNEIIYSILPPHPLPAENVQGFVSLRSLGPDRTEIVWRSEASDFQVPPTDLGARIEQFYAASIDGLSRLLSAA